MPLTASPVEQPLGHGTFDEISAISSVGGETCCIHMAPKNIDNFSFQPLTFRVKLAVTFRGEYLLYFLYTYHIPKGR